GGLPRKRRTGFGRRRPYLDVRLDRLARQVAPLGAHDRRPPRDIPRAPAVHPRPVAPLTSSGGEYRELVAVDDLVPAASPHPLPDRSGRHPGEPATDHLAVGADDVDRLPG